MASNQCGDGADASPAPSEPDPDVFQRLKFGPETTRVDGVKTTRDACLGHHLLEHALLRGIGRNHSYLISMRRHALVDQIPKGEIFIALHLEAEQAMDLIPVALL